ncbi:DinB superfamily protein [Pseudonocardia thermophila]|uniref:DinB superfamily protein n=1 Tax=Pseudonocardia thermophila TaxID=1848 RepID=A0A1M6WGZ8_PSETH|nr:DinB superfamily protein [Pseudonocardia thermophila]
MVGRVHAPVPPLPAEDHRCPSCGLAYAELTVEAATATVAEASAAAAAALTEVPPHRLRVAPDPGTWSPLEYLCHLRDVAITSTIRLHRARTEDRPVAEPMLADLRAQRFRYAEADPAAVLDELHRAVAGLVEEIGRLGADDWAHTVTRFPGEERTARWLVRNAAHELRHHVADLRHAGTVEIVVRPRAEADVAVLIAVLRDVRRRDGYPLHMQHDLGDWLCGTPVIGAWVADHGGGVVGHVALRLPEPDDPVAALVGEPVAVVCRLFVARDERGKGLGERLVRAAWREAAARGLRPALDVLTREAAAVALYERMGWQRVGEITHTIDGGAVPAICFAPP